MIAIFAVVRTRGPNWNGLKPMERQQDWDAHAAFMNQLHKEGFVIAGGPIEGSPDVLLIVRAADEEGIKAKFAGDCWVRQGMLRLTHIAPWNIVLGSL